MLDLPEQHIKTGISHRYLRPHLGLVDPLLTLTLPPQVTASCGLDVVCHAAESFVARPYTTRPAPPTPDARPPYQGANPISDVWSGRALEDGGRYLRRAVAEGTDLAARSAMMLAASLAGIGFGSAGVHIPHACADPIASLKHRYQAAGYPDDHPFIRHGFSVIVTALAAFRHTFAADPEKHRSAAALLVGRPIDAVDANTLPDLLVHLMQEVGAPRGLRELGYEEADIPDLVDGALKQQRLLAIAPCAVDAPDLAAIFRASLENW